MNEMNYNIHQVAENTWAMQEGTMVSSYLVIGSETALLIDAGGMLPEMRERVEELTGLPVTVTLTHGHGDHIHCLKQFESACVDPADIELIRGGQTDIGKCVLKPIGPGHIFDLGGRQIEALGLRGHTRGGLAYLDRQNRLLFSGDTINLGPVFMFMPESDFDVLIAELKRYDAMDDFDLIFPAHNKHPIGPEKIKDMIACAEAVRDGKIEGTEPQRPLPPGVKVYMKGDCGFFR
ncbi:MAG: MBL fold metallo-hydrolase [Clostridiales bacterium]|nr:MBL fold metallo-hydrolase [Clostridiales bacterium]